MRKMRSNPTIKAFFEDMEKGKVSFDYPIQRAGEQWNEMQKSLLVHSIACDYPVPPLYALGGKIIEGNKEKEILYILDGKQRSTNIQSFLNDEWRLDDNTPAFIIDDEKIDGRKCKFSELDDKIKDKILSFILDVYKLEDAEDEEIEDVFYRLNNGTSLTTQQKAKAKLGVEMALKLKRAMEHPMMFNTGEKDSPHNVVFTKLQREQAQDEVALVQAMMLIDDDFQVGKFGTQDVFDYTLSLREGKDHVLENLIKALDLLHEVFGKGIKEKHLLKKINFPFVVYASHQAVQKGLSAQTFRYWIDSFRDKLMSKENGIYLNGAENPNAWLYKVGSGAGATKAEKVAQRLKATNDELEAFYKELEDETKEEEKARLELQAKRERERLQAEKAEEAKAKKAEADKARKAKAEADKAKKAQLAEQKKAEAEPKQV